MTILKGEIKAIFLANAEDINTDHEKGILLSSGIYLSADAVALIEQHATLLGRSFEELVIQLESIHSFKNIEEHERLSQAIKDLPLYVTKEMHEKLAIKNTLIEMPVFRTEPNDTKKQRYVNDQHKRRARFHNRRK